MAKQRKQKQKDVNNAPTPATDSNRPQESCCAIVLSQKLCVAVDILQQRIFGYTELTVAAPKNGVIGLHARGLHIEQVSVDGATAPFELVHQDSGRQHGLHSEAHSHSSCAADAADFCHSRYMAALDEEMVPELLIRPGEVFTPVDASQNQQASGVQAVAEAAKDNGGGVQPSTPADTKPSEAVTTPAVAPTQEQWIVVRVDYWVEKPLAGAHFDEKVFHTNNQLRRARCWFPCVDSTYGRCSFSLEVTVATEYIAVSNGKLLHQVHSREGPHLKTYAYSMSVPVMASCISLVVAPLVVLPDRSNATVTHFCMAGDAMRLQCTVNFFPVLFSTYEEYLGAQFPFECYKQVFVVSESSISSVTTGASMATFSAHLLIDERIIDQAFITQVKLAQTLAHQWFGVFITPETPADAWLLEGLAGFLCDQFVKRYVGNNEALYRRYKANEAVCMADGAAAPVLSWTPASGPELFGTETLGALGQIRAWKATAVVQMLEKQMGPEPFKKILQRIILRAQDPVRQLRTLSTKEFRHFANKLGNLERPYLKEFFPRWVETTGCPRLRLAFLYSKRRNMVEVAIHRESTASSELCSSGANGGERITADLGWPGMMSIWVHELDGMYDHPSLPMAGDAYQLLDIQCHSKLVGRRVGKTKKGTKADGAADDGVDQVAADMRLSSESPLLWLRADPKMEYIAEIHLSQPEQMWINQLEKDRDVVGQLQAIEALVALPRPSFAVTTALNNCMIDSKVFCRVRIEAAYGLANTAVEANSWTGLGHLIKFYKNCRCDPEIGLPRSNDFHDLAEYLVLESLPGAIATVRGSDGKSPVEATDFIYHILKHNDNSGNQFSDVFWLASVIESIGVFEFGQQSMQILSKFLKQIDRVLQYDRLMPSYNFVLTTSCIHALTRLAMKLSEMLPLDRVKKLLLPFGNEQNSQHVRSTALQSILEVEAHFKGLDSSMQLALRFLEAEPCLMVQSKLVEHFIDVIVPAQRSRGSLSSQTLADVLLKLGSMSSFRNVYLRHQIFSLIHILAGRPASLYRREDVVKLEMPPLEKPLQEMANSKDSKSRATSLKGKAQQPPAEPLRLRVVPVRANSATKKETPAASASSGGGKGPPVKAPPVKAPSVKGPPVKEAQRVGKVKLRLKPSSLNGGGVSPMELSAGSFDRGVVGTNEAASQSPGSVQVSSAKIEPTTADESSQSCRDTQKQVSIGHVKQEAPTPTPVNEAADVESAADNVMLGISRTLPETEEKLQFSSANDVVVGGEMESSKDPIAPNVIESMDKDFAEIQMFEEPAPQFEENGLIASSRSGSSQNQAASQQPHSQVGTAEENIATPQSSGVSKVVNTAEKAASTATDEKGSGHSHKKEKKDKDHKHKKDKKDKKDKKKHSQGGDGDQDKKKRSRENDIEHQERKRRRKEEKKKREKEQKKLSEMGSAANKPSTDVVVPEKVPKPEADPVPAAAPVVVKSEGDTGQKLRLKFKRPDASAK